jgi:hypothetical protein
MLRRGKRHYIAAPAKEGKSIAVEAHLVDMALAGAKVVVLDRENGQETYAERLADIMKARRLELEQREQVRVGLRYFEFPQLKAGDEDELIGEFAAADLVVFDSQRMFLSDLGMSEDASDDYARFMSYIVEPLFRAGVATLILDNTGHKDTKRGRGSTSKGDLNEILFYLETVTPFTSLQRGQVKLVIDRSRSGNSGEWTMDLGGGYFYPFKPVNIDTNPRSDFREAVEEVLTEGGPRGEDKLFAAIRTRGVRISTEAARYQLKQYVKDPSSPIAHGSRGYSCASA